MSYQVYSAANLPPSPPAFTPISEVLEEFLAALKEHCASERIQYLASDAAQEEDED